MKKIVLIIACLIGAAGFAFGKAPVAEEALFSENQVVDEHVPLVNELLRFQKEAQQGMPVEINDGNFIYTVRKESYIKEYQDSLKELYAGIDKGDVLRVKKVLQSKKFDLDPPFQFSLVMKPLFIAAKTGQTEIAGLLLDVGADIEGRDSQWDTPLMAALGNRYLDTARFLIENGANLNGQNIFGITPFMLICAFYDPDFVQFALKYGANPRESYPCFRDICYGKHNMTPWQAVIANKEHGAEIRKLLAPYL